MRYASMRGCAWHTTLIVTLTLCVRIGYAEILFQDDFERLEIDLNRWAPQVSWGIKDNDTRHDVLGRKVLDVWGGGEGLTLTDFPEEFDYYADFKAMNGGSMGFVFHGQDAANLYMHEISTSGGDHTPQHIRWHRREGEIWTVEVTRFADERKRKQNVWYRVKFEVRKDAKFKAYLGKVGAKWSDLVFVGEWVDSKEVFKMGKIGFHTRGGNRGAAAHYAQYDNVFVTTPEFNIFSIEPKDKLTGTWGKLKE